MDGASSTEPRRTLEDLVVVLVEDSDLLLGVMHTTLHPFFKEVRTFMTAYAASVWLSKNMFDIVICDLLLKDGSGASVLEFARSKNADAALIVCSGDTHGYVQTDRKRVQILNKPFTPAELRFVAYNAGESVIATQQTNTRSPEGLHHAKDE